MRRAPPQRVLQQTCRSPAATLSRKWLPKPADLLARSKQWSEIPEGIGDDGIYVAIPKLEWR